MIKTDANPEATKVKKICLYILRKNEQACVPHTSRNQSALWPTTTPHLVTSNLQNSPILSTDSQQFYIRINGKTLKVISCVSICVVNGDF